jgi:hypothetical protein
METACMSEEQSQDLSHRQLDETDRVMPWTVKGVGPEARNAAIHTISSTQPLPDYADPDAEAVILSASYHPDAVPDRMEVIPIKDDHLILAVHEIGVTDRHMPAAFIVDRTGADQLREMLDRYFPHPG